MRARIPILAASLVVAASIAGAMLPQAAVHAKAAADAGELSESSASDPPEASASDPPEASASDPPEASASDPPEASASDPPEARPTDAPEAGVPARPGEPAASESEEVVSGDFDVDDPNALASMAFAGGVGKVATTSVRAANSLTAFGVHVAPRYMTQIGDVDVSALGGYVNFPADGGNLLGAQVSLQARLMAGVVAIADMGPLSSVGLRGPVWGDEAFTVGWAAHYRSDVYFAVEPGFGLAPAGFGLVPGFPGGQSQGVEAALNGEYAHDALRVYGTPLLSAMSNRTAAGLVLGADYDLGPFTLGYGATAMYNFGNPGAGLATLNALELKHSLGIRLFLNDWAYIQVNDHFHQGDAYGMASNTLLAGVGTRLLGSFSRPEVRVAKAPPAPEPMAPPLPQPSPPPVAAASPAPDGTPAPDYDSLVGTIRHSLNPGGLVGKPIKVELKTRTARGWANAPQSVMSDANGRYVFHRLPDGEYEVVVRTDRSLRRVASAAVSEAVHTKAWTTPTVDLDLAWDEPKIKGRIRGNTVEVEWPSKASAAPDTMYEVILKYSPEKPFVSGSKPASGTSVARWQVSDEIKRHKLYYTVKYWKKGGAFWGGNYYGQSNYKVLEVVK